MYLRPNQIFLNFVLEKKGGEVNSRGRPINSGYAADNPPIIIHGVLADASEEEKERWKQLQHPITHTIVQKGAPKAAENDCLVLDGRNFYIQGIDSPGGLNIWALYHVEERRDT